MGHLTVNIVGSVILLLLRYKLGEAVQVSKACFGSPGLTCTRHRLGCSRGRIAIKEAFYMDNVVCGAFGIASCFNVSSFPLNGTKYEFTEKELTLLHKDCSTKSTCSLQAGRAFPNGFSAIIYQCMNETINMCNVTNIQRTDTSFIWRGPSDQNTCVCSVSKLKTREPPRLNLEALEMRYPCPNLTISVDGVTIPINCSQFNSNRILLNSTSWIHVIVSISAPFPANNSVIWIGIQSTAVISIVCNESPTTFAATNLKTTTLTTRRQGTTPTLMSPRTTIAFSGVPTDQTIITEIGTGITQTVATVSTTAKTETNNGIGVMFAAGLFSGLAIAAVIAGVVYFFHIRRRCVIKKPDPGPASPNHPTYTGLTDLGRPDTYDIIDRPEAVTKPSETCQAPVYQNVDDDS